VRSQKEVDLLEQEDYLGGSEGNVSATDYDGEGVRFVTISGAN